MTKWIDNYVKSLPLEEQLLNSQLRVHVMETRALSAIATLEFSLYLSETQRQDAIIEALRILRTERLEKGRN